MHVKQLVDKEWENVPPACHLVKNYHTSEFKCQNACSHCFARALLQRVKTTPVPRVSHVLHWWKSVWGIFLSGEVDL
jgi:beta-glucanase (GH16 family)